MIIDRYLLRQLWPPFLGVALVLSAIFFTFALARLLTDASAGMLQLSEVLRLTGLRWLIAQEVLLPIALYLGVILAWGRLYQDSEMTALKAGGLNDWRLLKPLLRLCLLLVAIVAFLSLWVRPWAWQEIYEVEARAEASAEIDRIGSARFNAYAQDRTVFIERILEDGALEGVFIRKRTPELFELLSAPTGQFTAYVTQDSHQLVLHHAQGFRETREGPSLYGRFGSLTLRFPAKTPATVHDKAKTKSTSALWLSGTPHDSAELQWRFSAPLTALLLLLAAVPLTRSGPRQGRYGRLLMGLAVYAIYFNLVGVARTWVEQGQMAQIAWVHGALLLLIAALWWRGRYRL